MREIVHGDDLQRVVSVAVRHRADIVVAAVNAPYLGFGERHADAAADDIFALRTGEDLRERDLGAVTGTQAKIQ